MEMFFINKETFIFTLQEGMKILEIWIVQTNKPADLAIASIRSDCLLVLPEALKDDQQPLSMTLNKHISSLD